VKGIKALEQSKKKAGRLQGGTSRISADPSFAFMPAGSAWLKIFFKNHLKKILNLNPTSVSVCYILPRVTKFQK